MDLVVGGKDVEDELVAAVAGDDDHGGLGVVLELEACQRATQKHIHSKDNIRSTNGSQSAREKRRRDACTHVC